MSKVDLLQSWDDLRDDVEITPENYEIGKTQLEQFIHLAPNASDDLKIAFLLLMTAAVATTQRVDGVSAKVELLGKLTALQHGWRPGWKPGDPVGEQQAA